MTKSISTLTCSLVLATLSVFVILKTWGIVRPDSVPVDVGSFETLLGWLTLLVVTITLALQATQQERQLELFTTQTLQDTFFRLLQAKENAVSGITVDGKRGADAFVCIQLQLERLDPDQGDSEVATRLKYDATLSSYYASLNTLTEYICHIKHSRQLQNRLSKILLSQINESELFVLRHFRPLVHEELHRITTDQ